MERANHDLAKSIPRPELRGQFNFDSANCLHGCGNGVGQSTILDRCSIGLEIADASGNSPRGTGDHVIVDVHVHRLRVVRLVSSGSDSQRLAHTANYRNRVPVASVAVLVVAIRLHVYLLAGRVNPDHRYGSCANRSCGGL